MTIDLSRYRHSIKPIVEAFVDRDEGKEPMHELCGRIAIATNCPIIAVGHYMAELYGMTPELRGFLDRLITFYKVDSITNQEAYHEQTP